MLLFYCVIFLVLASIVYYLVNGHALMALLVITYYLAGILTVWQFITNGNF